MKRKALVLTSLAAALMLGTAATSTFAQQPDRPQRGGAAMFVALLQQFDADKNGQISKDEAKSGQEAIFAEIDADKDGVLTPGELRKHREAKMAEWRNTAQAGKGQTRGQGMGNGPQDDSGPNAQVPRDGEGQQAMGPRDGKGRWGRDWDGPRHGHHKGWGDRDGWRGHGIRGDNRGPGMGEGPRGPRMMMRMADTDENGQISKQEAAAMMDTMFTRMDSNGDGVISADDMPKRPFWLRG